MSEREEKRREPVDVTIHREARIVTVAQFEAYLQHTGWRCVDDSTLWRRDERSSLRLTALYGNGDRSGVFVLAIRGLAGYELRGSADVLRDIAREPVS
jgi:hypothetical protein